MRLKSIKIEIALDGTVKVTPQFFGKKGSTLTIPRLGVVGRVLEDVIQEVIERIRSRYTPRL